MNQRPIGPVSNYPDDGKYLCPNNMLLGRATSEVLQGPFNDTKNPRRRVEFVQKNVDSFWKRWSRDVLQALVTRKAWHTERRNVEVDDIIVMADNNAIRGKWTIGRVIEVYPGTDQGHPTNLFLTLSVPQRNLAGWQKGRCFDELAGKFIIDRGFSWELLTFSSISTQAGCRNSED